MCIGCSFLSAARGLKPIARITCGLLRKDGVAKVECRACGLQTSRNDLPLAREEENDDLEMCHARGSVPSPIPCRSERRNC